MARKKKTNRLENLLLYVFATLVMTILTGVPLALVSYAWFMYALNAVSLSSAIFVSSILAVSEGLLITIIVGGEK